VSVRPAARGLLLDLDGTLLDTAPDMGGALNRLLRENGRAELPLAEIRPHVSHGAAALVRLGFGAEDPDAFEARRQRFLALYALDLASGTRLFPGFEAVLSRLAAATLPWGIVTNKPTALTLPLLEATGLAARAGCVVCGDTFAERKPHPRPMLHAAQTLGLAPADLLYVGDAERDIEAGRAAGMRTLAARFGYLAADEDPGAWRPDGVIDRPEDLLPWLAL
jgi:N-acetyl-D-muramate 6-phosphate phosphatase